MLTKAEATTLIRAECVRLIAEGEKEKLGDKIKDFWKASELEDSIHHLSVRSIAQTELAKAYPPDPVMTIVSLGFSVTSITQSGEFFILDTEHGKVMVVADQLLNNNLFRRAALTQIHKVVPSKKQQEWEAAVQSIIETSLIIDDEVTQDSSVVTATKEALMTAYQESDERELSFLNKKTGVINDGHFCIRVIDLVRALRLDHDRRGVPRTSVVVALRELGFTLRKEENIVFWSVPVDKMDAL